MRESAINGAAAVGRGALLVWDHTIGWIVAWLFIGVIRVYQIAISPLFPPSCRYYPCCSSYGLVAMHVHGSAKGSMLTGWRLLRCNPWSRGGIDPVPERGRWRPDILPDGRPRAPRRGAQASG